jgi:F420-dependent oxidoreductase-like protein
MAPMQLRTFTEPQFGATYDDLLAVAQATEAGGFDAFFRSDHFLTMGGDGLPGPTDSWLTLAALARETSRIHLGTLVTSATFRLPGVLAASVAQVSQMSGGRVELGLGSGWYEQEHTAYGVPFPSLSERFERLEEQLEIITGMWATPVGDLFTHQGKHYSLTDSPALPKPVAPVPIIVGGWGTKRTPRLAARFATEFNVPFGTVTDTQAGIDRVRAAAGGRQLIYSTAQVVACGRDSAELERRIRATGRDPKNPGQDGLFGTPDQVIARLREYAAVGASRAYLQLLDVHDLDHIELLAGEVLPAVADL